MPDQESTKQCEACMTEENANFWQGFAAALGTLARDHGCPGMAVDIMRLNGVSLEQLVEAGAMSFDLDPLRAEIASTTPSET